MIISYVYQYVLRKYHLHMYIIGTRIYTRIQHFIVYIPDNLIPVLILLYHYYHIICVPIHAQVTPSVQVLQRYWDIYENISWSIWQVTYLFGWVCLFVNGISHVDFYQIIFIWSMRDIDHDTDHNQFHHIFWSFLLEVFIL